MWKGNRREKLFVSQGEERLLLKTWHSDSFSGPICISVASADEQEDWDIKVEIVIAAVASERIMIWPISRSKLLELLYFFIAIYY